MVPRTPRLVLVLVALALVTAVAATPAMSQAPKSGGVLTLQQREELTVGFAIHETATIATIWPASRASTTWSTSTR